MSNVWRKFGKCLDGCGAEPGTACRNDDDEVSETPCAGRPTVLRVQRQTPQARGRWGKRGRGR